MNMSWKFLLKLILTGLAIWLVLQKISIQEITPLFKQVNWAVILFSLILFNYSKIISANRLLYFFKAEGIYLTSLQNLKLYYIGMFYNLFLPGGIGGDGYKVYILHSTLNVPFKNATRAIVWDRISGLIAITIISLCLSLSILPSYFQHSIYWIVALIIIVMPTFYWITIRFFPKYRETFKTTTLLAFGVQLTQILISVLIFFSLQVSITDLPEYTIVFLASSLVSVIPISLGGVGIRELVFLTAAQYTSVIPEKAVTFTVIFFLITAVSSLIGIFIKENSIRNETPPLQSHG